MRAFVVVVLMVAALSLGFYLWIKPATHEGPSEDASSLGLGPGSQAPEIRATGWVNGEAPTAEDLRGKVLVVDAWATWCDPCRRTMPELVRLHEQYNDQGVVFIGLTSQGEEELPEIVQFLDQVGADWLNGYGARQTMIELQAEMIPATWVIGADGIVVWNGHPAEHAEMIAAIEDAIAAAAKPNADAESKKSARLSTAASRL